MLKSPDKALYTLSCRVSNDTKVTQKMYFKIFVSIDSFCRQIKHFIFKNEISIDNLKEFLLLSKIDYICTLHVCVCFSARH